ncbi:hypothetical protein GGI35DRAFT_463677 [Trichoderma velutinum]
MRFLTTMMLATLAYGRALESFTSLTDSHGKTLSTKSECTPGSWACGDASSDRRKDRIAVCNSSGVFVLSAVCGGSGCCGWASNALPFCYC